MPRAATFVKRIAAFARLNSFGNESPSSGNMLMPMLIEAPLVMRTFSKYDEAELLRSASHHLEIVSALEARDADWAAAIMRSHIHAAQHSIGRQNTVGANRNDTTSSSV